MDRTIPDLALSFTAALVRGWLAAIFSGLRPRCAAMDPGRMIADWFGGLFNTLQAMLARYRAGDALPDEPVTHAAAGAACGGRSPGVARSAAGREVPAGGVVSVCGGALDAAVVAVVRLRVRAAFAVCAGLPCGPGWQVSEDVGVVFWKNSAWGDGAELRLYCSGL